MIMRVAANKPMPGDGEVALPKLIANYAALSPLSFLARSAEVYPDHPAIIYGAKTCDWQTVYRRCQAAAARLHALGIQTGDVVAIIAPNIPALFDAHFFVPMCGAVLNAINTRPGGQNRCSHTATQQRQGPVCRPGLDGTGSRCNFEPGRKTTVDYSGTIRRPTVTQSVTSPMPRLQTQRPASTSFRISTRIGGGSCPTMNGNRFHLTTPPVQLVSQKVLFTIIAVPC